MLTLRRVSSYVIDCLLLGLFDLVGCELLGTGLRRVGRLLAFPDWYETWCETVVFDVVPSMAYFWLMPFFSSTTVGMSICGVECAGISGGRVRPWQWCVRMMVICGVRGISAIGLVTNPRDSRGPLPISSWDLLRFFVYIFAVVALLATSGTRGVHDVMARTVVRAADASYHRVRRR